MTPLEPALPSPEAHDSEHETDASGSEDVLIEDLEDALSNQFTFEGSFACASMTKTAPNPCLSIEGLGSVGLPLSERDAKLIIESSAQAPYGHGSETLINKDVRDTWEIEPQKISFLNSAWEPYIQSVVCSVCSSLGVQSAQIMPRCELYKLLLYQVGSHFLPHQDTQKADGMFATMVIVLPSVYTGGQVHVSHGTQSKVFDCSQDSIIYTSILAWYTDVFHEVKPVTSGFRLALSYNLIHVSPTLPKPMLPDMDGPIQNLRTVLKNWKENAYTVLPKDSLVAYILDHQYSEKELLRGAMSLKGVDAHKISFLWPIADEMGYTLCLGNLTYKVYGDADDGYNTGKWKKRDDDDYEMAEVYDKSTEVSCVVDLNGVRLLKNKLKVDNGSVIPANHFEDAEPDEKSYGGYMGNSAGSLNLYYRRTALVVIRKEDTLNVFCSNRADGFKYGLDRLKGLNNVSPTQLERDVANAMIKNLGSQPRKGDYSDSKKRTDEETKTMVDYAFMWEDSEMWSMIMQRVGSQYLESFGTDAYFEGWDKFSFSKIEQGLAGTILSIAELRKRLDFIRAIRTHAAKINEIISEDWYKQKLIEALSTFQIRFLSDDVEMLLHVVRTWGLRVVYENVIYPMRGKANSFDFWLKLVHSMLKKKAILCAPRADRDDGEVTQPQPQQDVSSNLCPESEFDAVSNFCLSIIVSQWNDIPTSPIFYSRNDEQVETAKIDRIIQILDVCASAGRVERCHNLFVSIMAADPNAEHLPTRFKSFYVPLVPKMVELLKNRNISLTSPPFDAFARQLINLYIRFILGTSQSLTEEVAKLQKLGCDESVGCHDCIELDRFMTNPTQTVAAFSLIEPRRRHLQERLTYLFCEWTTIKGRPPYTLQVTKRNDYFARMSWDGRRTTALAFLHSFGNDDLLSELMGHQWGEILATLQDPVSSDVCHPTPPSHPPHPSPSYPSPSRPSPSPYSSHPPHPSHPAHSSHPPHPNHPHHPHHPHLYSHPHHPPIPPHYQHYHHFNPMIPPAPPHLSTLGLVRAVHPSYPSSTLPPLPLGSMVYQAQAVQPQPPIPFDPHWQKHRAHPWSAQARAQRAYRSGPLTPSMQIMNQTSHGTAENLHLSGDGAGELGKKRKRSSSQPKSNEVIDLTQEN